jgi:predicted porin
LSGNLDFAGANVGGTQLWAKGSTVSTTVGTASTSVINIRAVEDLGAGMKVTAHYGLDPRLLANDSLSATNNVGAVTNSGAQVCAAPNTAATTSAACVLGTVNVSQNTPTGLARDEVFVGIEGAYGNVRLGSPNSIGLNSFQVASPAGTGIGSGYTGGSSAGTMTNSFVNTRYNRSVRWDSPVIAGFTAAVLYAPGNDQTASVTAATISSSTGAVTPAVPVANLIPNARKSTELGLRYDNGPLSVSYANIVQADQINATGFYANASNSKAVKTSANLLNASYNLGATTLYAGWNNGDRLGVIGSASATATTNVPSKGSRFGIKHTMGNIDLIAQQTIQQALGVTGISSTTAGAAGYSTDTLKAKVTGFRADYNMSKTAAVYVGYEKYDTGAAYAASALTSTGDRSLTSIGLKKQF